MRHHHPYDHGLGRLVGNILALLLIGWVVLRVGQWLGWTAPPACYLGWGLGELLGSTLLETLAVLGVLTWMLTLGRRVEALMFAVVMLVVISYLGGQVPALLASC